MDDNGDYLASCSDDGRVINKIDIIQSELSDFDIITLNETWLEETIDTNSLLIEGYQEPFRKDRKTNRYGGVMIYLKNHTPSRRRPDLELDEIECLWIECEFHSSKVLIGTFYRPPNSDIKKWDLIAFSIEKAKDTGISKILITGDFNDNLHEPRNSKILEIIESQGMHQLITNSTHFTESTETLLDLLIVNNLDLVETAGVGDNILHSNTRFHCPIFGVLNFPKPVEKSFTRKVWLFTKTDFITYKSSLCNIPWDSLISGDINEACKNVTDTIIRVAENNIPNKIITYRRKDPPWMHNAIRSIIRKRKRLHRIAKHTDSPTDWEKYRKVRNKSVSKVRNAIR